MEETNGEDVWLERLRDALTHGHEPELASEPVAAFEDTAEPSANGAVPASEAVVAPPGVDAQAIVLGALAELSATVERLSQRAGAADISAVLEGRFEQGELDAVVANAIRQATLEAMGSGTGTVRLETEVRVLERTVANLSKQVSDLNLTALARDRLEKDVHVEALVEAATKVERQLDRASRAQTAFDMGVEKMLRHAQEGEGENVAWTDVMLLAHELRSRVDDLDDQQRRAIRDLAEWQTSVDDRLVSLRARLLEEIRALRDPLS